MTSPYEPYEPGAAPQPSCPGQGVPLPPEGAVPPPGCPAHGGPSQTAGHPDPNVPMRLYGPEFAADPHGFYTRLRQYGAVAPVEIAPDVPALLVTDYRAALELLNDDTTWSKDSRAWMQTVPPDSPVMPMLHWRPNVFYSDGPAHVRYRDVIVDSFKLVEPHELRARVHDAADTLIRRFGDRGEADLIADYARLIPLLMFNTLFGLPDSYSDRLIAAIAGMLEGNSPEEAQAANEAYTQYIMELVGAKKAQRGPDLTSWMMDHPNELGDEELIHNIILVMGAGNEPLANLIGNALARMLSDDRYYNTVSGGALTVHDAINEVLWNDPPMANYSAHFPVRDVFFHGTWVRAGQLVMVSYAAANSQFDTTGAQGPGSGSGSHLAWAAGPHACPVKRHALLIAITAIERLTAWLSDIELAVHPSELEWRNGVFHRALAALPTRFTPITPDQAGATPWQTSGPSSSTPPEPTSTAKQPASAH
ncbi:cytochrome P450 [Streptomyces noursei]|uniref:cytochrome P450 n=1 Tax=Streptomyces noursei TaxID=1971 RepID=UPI003823799A